MCDPITAGILIVSALGTGASMYATDTAAKQQEANLKFQAAQSEADAKAEAGAAQVEAERIRKQAKSKRSQAVAAAAASGIDVNSPTALKIDKDITAANEEDALLTILQGSDRAKRLNQQAAADRLSASSTRLGAKLENTGTLLSGLSSIATQGQSAWKTARGK